MDKQQAIAKLEKQRSEIENLKELKERRSSPEFTKWYIDTEIAIRNVFFKKDSRKKLTTFNKKVNYRIPSSSNKSNLQLQNVYINRLNMAHAVLSSFIEAVNGYWDDNVEPLELSISSIEKVELLCERFHNVAIQLQHRHANRPTIKIENEYDMQDLFHSLLAIYFDDIRDEEWTPSYAGACSRVDFLLKQEKIVIELKKTRKGLTKKEIGDQLLIDIQRYQVHPDCENLICFVYDPEARIDNPKGLENDLTKITDGLNVKVIIRP